jgi:hypothetical protein
MIRLADFKTFYDTTLIRELEFIEKERKSLVVKIVTAIALATLVFPTLAFYLIVVKKSDPTELLYFLPFIPMIAFAIYMALEPFIKSAIFYRHFKWKVINSIIQFINPSLNYDKRMFVPKHEYAHSSFFDDVSHVNFWGDDHVSGIFEKVKIEFSELKTKYQTKHGKEAYQFRGIFFVGKFPAKFNVNIVISNKKQVGFVPTETDNRHFDDMFFIKVLSGEPAEIKEFLAMDLLANIVEFYQQIHKDLYISFIDNKMYVGISHDKDLFEPQLWTTNTNFDFIYMHFNDLYFPISIIEHFAKKS